MFTNRVAKYLNGTANASTHIGGGDSMGKTTAPVSQNGEVLTAEQQEIAERTAMLLQKVIKKKWRGKDRALAERAEIDPSKLSVLKTKGAHKVIPSLTALCRALGIDDEKLVAGRIVDVLNPSRRPDLHAMLESLVGTPNEPAVEQVLKAFVKSSDH